MTHGVTTSPHAPLLSQAQGVIINSRPFEGDNLSQILQSLGIPEDQIQKVSSPAEANNLLGSMDLIILDGDLPDALTWAREHLLAPASPALLLTAADSRNPQVTNLMEEHEETDFVGRFWHPHEIKGRIRQLLTGHILKRRLEQQVQERTQELERTVEELVSRLADAIEGRDTHTGQHARRMSLYADALGRKYMACPREGDEIIEEKDLPLLRKAALLHDIGKLAVPDHILNKPDRLTPEEFCVIQSHPNKGTQILKNSDLSVLKRACEVGLTHHEKWNGRGYPQGLSQTGIPLMGRIVAIVDVFDALTGKRPYRKPNSPEEAFNKLESEKDNGHFDPHLLSQFLDIKDEIMEIYKKFPDSDHSQTSYNRKGCLECISYRNL
ncbi:MAG: HD domain-containing protein [Magnetococcales bacterium]|nr:HD domain-containing protein [Magnetococcales bacterium]